MGVGQFIKDVILRSGAMHIIMSFLGCIGTLMKGSGLDTFVGSAFGDLAGIMSGKVRATRAFRMVSAALLENFLQVNENNFDDILAHIEDGRKHPPGRHWVNNLLMPTLLAHQFLQFLPDTAKADLIVGAHVYHHSDAIICIYSN